MFIISLMFQIYLFTVFKDVACGQGVKILESSEYLTRNPTLKKQISLKR